MEHHRLARNRLRIIDTIAAPVMLLLIWVVVLRNTFDGSTTFALFADNEFFLGSVLSSMSESLRAGEWPLRMDTALAGLPLYNFTQLTAFYPLYLTFLPIYESVQESMYSMHMVTLLHLLIMEATTYFLLRVVGVSRMSAVAAAGLMTFSANNYNYAVWVNIIAPYAWLPLFLAGVIGLMQGRPRRRYALITVLGVCLLTFASPAQPLIHALFMAAVFSVFHFRECRSAGNTRGFMQDFLRPVVVLGILAFLVVAPALLPPVVELDEMIRWVGPFDPVYGNASIPFEVFESQQLPLAAFGGVFFRFANIDVGQQFIGLAVAGLALITVFSARRSWIINTLIFLAIYALVSAFGSNLGLGYLNYVVPGLNKIREPTRFLYIFHFATVGLAAFALDELRGLVSDTGARLLRRQWIALGALLMLAIVIAIVAKERVVSVIPPIISALVFAALIAATWLCQRVRSRKTGTVTVSAWIMVAVAMLAAEAPWYAAPISFTSYVQDDFAQLDNALERIVELDPAHQYRVIFGGELNAQNAAMTASYHGIGTLNAYFNPSMRRQVEELYYSPPRTDNYARMLGAKYLVCKNCSAEELTGYGFLENVAGYDIYTSDDARPHSYVATSITGRYAHLPDFISQAAAQDLKESPVFVSVDHTSEELGAMDGRTGRADAACSSTENSRRPNNVVVTVSCGTPAMLVLNKFNDGHWYARVDGKKIEVLEVNGNQLGVPVAVGSHSVEFYYAPLVVRVCLFLSVLASLVLCSLYFRQSVHSRKRN